VRIASLLGQGFVAQLIGVRIVNRHELDTGFQRSRKRSASEPALLARCAICFRRKIGHEVKESTRLA
jgi:hypothetical protein